MEPVFNVVLPVFSIIAAGYLAGRMGVLGDAASEALNRFVFYLALPALLFIAMARVDAAEIFNWPFIAAVMLGQGGVFLVALGIGRMVFKLGLAEAALFAMAAAFTNTGYMGIPLAMTAFGNDAVFPAVIATVINSAVMVGSVAALIEVGLRAGGGAFGIAKDVTLALVKNPIAVAPVAGILVSVAGLTLPKPVHTFCDILGAAAGPGALVAVGLFLVGKPIRQGAAEVGTALVLKLLVHPLITWFVAFRVLDLDPFLATMAVLMATLPAGANLFVLAQRYGVYVQRSSTALLASTVLSVITLSVFLSLAEAGLL